MVMTDDERKNLSFCVDGNSGRQYSGEKDEYQTVTSVP